MHKLKRIIRKTLRKLGYEVVSFPLPEGIPLGGHLLRVFKQLGITCVIDVGAHHGEYGCLLREMGYEGWIISFEPVSANFKVLKERSAADKRWAIYDFALGDHNGTAPINVTANSVFSSFLPPNAFAAEEFEEQVVVEQAESVGVRRLDEIFGDITAAIPEPKIFLKIDTQGCDIRVLRGSTGHLDQVLALQSEVSVYSIYDGMTDYLSAMQEMADLGFVVTGLFPVTRRNDGLRPIEFDCVMVRDSSVAKQLCFDTAKYYRGQGRSVVGLEKAVR
jgi:FkbM family methyltransferase